MMLVTYLIIGFLMLTLLSQYHTLQFVDARPTERCDAEVCHITITKEGFEPKTMMVRIGATVVWTNDDEGRHTVTSGSAREITTPLKSSLLESGDTYEFTFLHGGLYEGSYKYFDQATLGTGEIIVELEHAVMGKEEAFHFRQCRELITQGNYEDALFYCDEVLKLNPSNIEALNSKATALILLKKYNLSIMAFDKTLDLDPGNAKALAGKGFSLIALEKNEEGMAHIMTAFELEPENEYVLMAQVLSFEKQGKFARAMIEIDKVLEIVPEHPFVLMRKAELLVKLAKDNPDNYEQALSYYDKVLASEPNHVEAIVGKGNIHSQQDEYEKAQLAYDQALLLQPDNSNANLGEGIILLKLEQYDEAIEHFDMVLKNDPDNPLVLNRKGEALMKLGKYKEALTEFETALELEPDDPRIHTKKGDAALSMGNDRQAVRAYSRALEIDSDHVNAILGKALALVNIERYKESLPYFDDVLELESENINKTEGRWDAQSEVGIKAIKGKTEALTGLGNQLLQDESWREAEPKFSDALALDSQYDEAKKGKTTAENKISQQNLSFMFQIMGAIVGVVVVGSFAYNNVRKRRKTK